VKSIILAMAVGLSSCLAAPTDKVKSPSAVLVPASVPATDSIEINFPELQLVLADVDSADFKITVKGDTADIQSTSYAQIDGAKLYIKANELKGLRARIRFGFGVLQYLTDNYPAPQLDFSSQTQWRAIETSGNLILVPQFYLNRKDVIDVFKFLEFEDKGDFESNFESEHLINVKPISYATQKEQYTTLLAERNRYEKCCPEYIEQANEFLKKRIDDFKTFSDLGVEIILSELRIEISGTNPEGKQVAYTLTTPSSTFVLSLK